MSPEPVPSVLDAEPIDVLFPAPERQSRLLVLFRPLLAVPHVVVLWLILVGSIVLSVVGWFVALFLGRLPRPFARYQAHTLEYVARVYGFGMLLAAQFPPFRWQFGGYPVQTRARQSRVRRLGVFFRRFIAIPALIVTTLTFSGAMISGPVIWLIVLIRGRMPAALHDALAAVLRYQLRFNGWFWMITAVYPHELFGDRLADSRPEQRDWNLPLTRGARRLVALFLVLGIVYVGVIVTVAVRAAGSTTTAQSQRNQVVGAYDRLAVVLVRFQKQAKSCAGRLACVQRAETPVADALDRFVGELRAIDYPGGARADAAEAEAAATRMATQMRRAANARDAAAYARAARGLGQVGRRVDSDVNALLADF